jgi:hypothetical protein
MCKNLFLTASKGVFSMGHDIVPDTAGWVTFGWLMVVFVLVAVVFALSLQVIIGRLRRIGTAIDRLFDVVITRATDVPAPQSSMSAEKLLDATFRVK